MYGNNSAIACHMCCAVSGPNCRERMYGRLCLIGVAISGHVPLWAQLTFLSVYRVYMQYCYGSVYVCVCVDVVKAIA